MDLVVLFVLIIAAVCITFVALLVKVSSLSGLVARLDTRVRTLEQTAAEKPVPIAAAAGPAAESHTAVPTETASAPPSPGVRETLEAEMVSLEGTFDEARRVLQDGTQFQPPSAPSPSRTRQEWEALIGGKLLNRIGALALILGAGFFLKYAFDNNWLTETTRVLIGAAAGAGLLALAHRSRTRGFAVFAQGLVGAGIAILYLSVYASFNFYHLVSQPVAFILMAGVTVVAFTQALSYDSAAVALLGWAGGFLTPLLLSTGVPNEVGLFSYLALLDAGLIAVIMNKDEWAFLEPLTIVATYAFFFSWMAEWYRGEAFALTLFFAALFWLLFYGSDLVNSLRGASRIAEIRRMMSFANALLFSGPLYRLVDADHHAWTGAAFFMLSAAYAGGAQLLARRCGRKNASFVAALVIAMALCVAATAIQFIDFTIILFLAAESLFFAWYGRRHDLRSAWSAALLLQIASLFWLLFTPGALAAIDPVAYQPVLSLRAAAFLALALAMSILAWLSGTATASSSRVRMFLQYAAAFLLFVLLTVETNDLFRRMMAGTVGERSLALGFTRYMVLAVVWTVYAAVLAVLGTAKSLRPLLFSSLSVLSCALCLGAVRGIAFEPLSSFTPLLNVRTVALSLVILGGFWTCLRLTVDRETEWIPEWLFAGRAILVLLLLVALTGEIRDLFEKLILTRTSAGEAVGRADATTSLENLKQLSLSGAWLLFSLGLMGLGLWRRVRMLRLFAMVLFGVTILKIFIYDLSFLETLYRIFAFAGLGVILLATSYLYQRYRGIILADETRPHTGS